MTYYVDPEEGDGIRAALNWAQDHGSIREFTNLGALTQAAAALAPTCEPAILRAHITEGARTDNVELYVLAIAPPFPPLPADAWRVGPIGSTRPGGPGGIMLLIICEEDQLARLRDSGRWPA